MAAIAKNGYIVKGINNVAVKFYPQVLGIHQVHEHNLCNALRDFGLMLKSDCKRELLRYNYDFLKFANTMRSSELCMLAHGYSLIGLKDTQWWDRFTSVAATNSFDMDGKEMAGFLYSLSRVYNGDHPLIVKLLEESTHWIPHATAPTLSLLIKVIANLKVGDRYLDKINARAMEIVDRLNMVDIVFFITANTDAKTRNLELYRVLCLRVIELYDDIELHHLRALAACISIGGYKSHIFFNVLSIKLVELCNTKHLTDGDVISLFLAFTSQKFLAHNDLCIDAQVYKRFLKDRLGRVAKEHFDFPIPDVTVVLAQALEANMDRITYNGLPIVLRAIGILRLPVSEELYDRVIQETSTSVAQGKYCDLKLSNLVVTIAKRPGNHDVFWTAVHEVLTRPNVDIKADLLAKMTITMSNVTNEGCRHVVYRDLLELSLQRSGMMSIKSISALTRMLVSNMELEALVNGSYVDALVGLFDTLTIAGIFGILKFYPFKSLPAEDANVLRLKSAVKEALNKSDENVPCYKVLQALIDGTYVHVDQTS
ncbi:hypothetical protein BaOVIS_021680 [Babesia ovis]|uniref:Uncharacterized protein n=1 Tax=Babesia ovis TaxID=5869 RepID=A0A9W5WVD6_BABOV|nr:hypothetical protein BaOVIS_021680 [Babesia ovis]